MSNPIYFRAIVVDAEGENTSLKVLVRKWTSESHQLIEEFNNSGILSESELESFSSDSELLLDLDYYLGRGNNGEIFCILGELIEIDEENGVLLVPFSKYPNPRRIRDNWFYSFL